MSQSAQKQVDFNALTDAYYHAWFRYHPEAAVEAGVPGYAHLLTPFDEPAHAARVCLNNELLVNLNGIDRQSLDVDTRVDFDVLYGAAVADNHALLEVEPYRIDPARCLPINAIYQLTMRPVAAFAENLTARLAAIPAHLDAACAYLLPKAARVPPLWLESAMVSARRGVEYLRTLPRHPKLSAISDLDAPLTQATAALTRFAAFLESDIKPQAAGDFACGAAHFNALLQLRHFLDVDADALYALGERLFIQTERDVHAACRALGSEDVVATARRIQLHHPKREELLATYTRQMQAARAFVAARDLVTLPTRERLDVIDTPVFLRHQIPFAAYHDPAPNDAQQQGYYYVTPPQSEAELAEHDHFGLMHTCVHEAWPGHHLQFVTANLNPLARQLPRLLNASATLYEGWALYSEQLMHEQGFLAAPEQRFILLRDRLWRALRIMIDVDIHTRGMSLDAAATRLERHLGFPRSQALAELNWYSKSPTVPMGYATGWALINALRDRERMQVDFDLKRFHDRLLSVGSVALPLTIQRAFGMEQWHAVRNMVFDS